MKNDNLVFVKLVFQVLALQALFILLGLVCIVTGKLAVFTKATINNKSLTMKDLGELIMKWGGVVETAQGTVVFCHGKPNGQMVLSREELAEKVNPGTYWLVSCYNGNRKSFEINGRTFFRVPETCLPLRSYATGFHGILVVGTTSWLDKIHTIGQDKANRLKELIAESES